MNASDQEAADQEVADQSAADREAADHEAVLDGDREYGSGAGGRDHGSVAGDRANGAVAEDREDGAVAGDGGRPGMTPRQARRLRIAAASGLMILVAVFLAIRLASRSSVLVVGVYGLLLVLCGLVIELSRRGRTRLGTYLLGTGLVAALLGDWVLLP